MSKWVLICVSIMWLLIVFLPTTKKNRSYSCASLIKYICFLIMITRGESLTSCLVYVELDCSYPMALYCQVSLQKLTFDVVFYWRRCSVCDPFEVLVVFTSNVIFPCNCRFLTISFRVICRFFYSCRFLFLVVSWILCHYRFPLHFSYLLSFSIIVVLWWLKAFGIFYSFYLYFLNYKIYGYKLGANLKKKII